MTKIFKEINFLDDLIVNRNIDMVRKAGKLQRLFARMLMDHISLITWYAKVHNFRGVTFNFCQERCQYNVYEYLTFLLNV